MTVYVDTRENDPLKFNEHGVHVEVKKLDFGDYGCEVGGEMSRLVFERKTLGDLWGTLTKGHGRFRRELLRAKESKAMLILAIEGTDSDVLNGYARSKVSGPTIMKTIDTMWKRYELVPMFCASRRAMTWRMINLWRTFQ